MIHTTLRQLIHVPRPLVFRMLERPDALASSNPAIVAASRVDDGEVEAGSRFKLHRTDSRPAVRDVEVVVHEPDRRLALQGDFGTFAGALDYHLEDTPEGTRLTHVAHLEPKGPLRFIGPIASSQVRSTVAGNLDRLRHHLEATARTRTQARRADRTADAQPSPAGQLATADPSDA